MPNSAEPFRGERCSLLIRGSAMEIALVAQMMVVTVLVGSVSSVIKRMA